MSRQRSIFILESRAISCNNFACASCGSICVVRPFQVRFNFFSTNSWESFIQSASGYAAVWAENVPVAPFIFPLISVCLILSVNSEILL